MTPRDRADGIVSFMKDRPHMWTQEFALEIERVITQAILADRAERDQVTDDWLAKKLTAAIEQEREECAKIVEAQIQEVPARNSQTVQWREIVEARNVLASSIAEDIRARSEKADS